MRRRRQCIITIVIILFLGGMIGSGLAGEISARLTMAMKFVKTLDYYEYHWRGDKESRLLSMYLYTWQKRGTQRKCLEYTPISTVEAVLSAYTLEGYDSDGNCVYQKELTSEGTKETYWTYLYDGQGRILEKAVWPAVNGSAGEIPGQLQKYCYDDDVLKAEIVYDYQSGNLLGSMSYMTLDNGQESLREAREAERTVLSLGAYGREELICEGNDLIAYRWYEYYDDGSLRYLLEVTPEGADPVQYLCTYTVFAYDTSGRLKAAYTYEPVIEKYPSYYNHYKLGDVGTGIYLDFDDDGQLFEIGSVYYTDEDLPGEVLYYIFLMEDGTFEMYVK